MKDNNFSLSYFATVMAVTMLLQVLHLFKPYSHWDSSYGDQE